MKVLVVSFFNTWVTHLGTELELAQIHLDQGHTVEILGCDGCIIACQTNPHGLKQACDECRLRRLRGLQLLRPQVAQYRLGDYLPSNIVDLEEQTLTCLTDADSAQSFRYDGQDLGWGALSSTIMELRDPFCESLETKELLMRFGRTALRSYLAVKAFLESHSKFDRVYIFNGRFACTRGAFRACQVHGGLEIKIHERGSSVSKYQLFDDSMPHNRDLIPKRIESAWISSSTQAERYSIGRAFYEERRKGVPILWKSFTSKQREGLLPRTWDVSKKNIVIFSSSEDEFVGIGDDWRNPIYPSQSDGIRRLLVDAIVRYPDMHFHVRMHPNLIGVANKDVETLYAIKSANFTLIEPASQISTYALLDAAERVVTFGSTVGIEATFWGKVSILAGHCFYEQLDAVYVAQDHDDLLGLLGAELAPKPVLNALKYGFYLRSFGVPFQYWQPNGFEDGCFRGKRLDWSPNNLERRILTWCLDAGLHTRFLHNNTISGLTKVASYVWRGCRKHIRKVHV